MKKALLAIGDHARAGYLFDINVYMVSMITFLISSIYAKNAGVFVGGFASFSAAIVCGITLMGGKGSELNVMFRAMTLKAMSNLFNLLGLPKPYQDAQRGLLIIRPVAFVAFKKSQKTIMKNHNICVIISQFVNLKRVYQGGGDY